VQYQLGGKSLFEGHLEGKRDAVPCERPKRGPALVQKRPLPFITTKKRWTAAEVGEKNSYAERWRRPLEKLFYIEGDFRREEKVGGREGNEEGVVLLLTLLRGGAEEENLLCGL